MRGRVGSGSDLEISHSLRGASSEMSSPDCALWMLEVKGRAGSGAHSPHHRFSLLTTVSREVGLRGTEILFQRRRASARRDRIIKKTFAPQPNLSGNGGRKGESMVSSNHSKLRFIIEQKQFNR